MAVRPIKQLQLPVGWGADNQPAGLVGWVGALAGWLITIAALLLGAPFWFDVLSRVSRQRAVGIPEKPGRMLSDKPVTDAADAGDGDGDAVAARKAADSPTPAGDS